MKSHLTIVINIDYEDAKLKLSNVPIYWINLDRSNDRKQVMNDMFKQINTKNTRISAYDGKVIDEYTDLNFVSDITPYEIGCTASHLKCIKSAYDNGNDTAIIMEDDIGINFINKWDSSINDICASAPDDWEIIKIFGSYSKYTKLLIEKSSESLFVPWNKDSLGTGVYIINHKGMKKIMDLFYSNEKWNVKHDKAVADFILYDELVTYDYTKPTFNQRIFDSTIKSSHTGNALPAYHTVEIYYNPE
jgi:GR25 family glycosyltransferase involved in LPS biosynthesis